MAKRGPCIITSAASNNGAAKTIRCAIYTRKSTEEGLDQDFNSLDAQREACAAYIASQRHEGWACLPDYYDDPGFSGGTMERPGLKRLLEHVEAGKIDVIVVYKIDRLTRALSDFAKIVDILDRRDASFVSITQAFNTTTSMGRLTLNVLLSFAQFEREVTAERIRDKIAASKKKGMWMGGPVPLGYNVIERKLIIAEGEAEIVRLIFNRHRALKTLQALAVDLTKRGVRSKVRKMRDGRIVGGQPYSPGALGHLLRNRIYIGQIRHGDHVYPGEHEAILDQKTWDASQRLLAGNALRPHTGRISLLAGFIEDALGRRMRPEHTIKGDRRYRYYVSMCDDRITEPLWRLPAGDVEAVVIREMVRFMHDPPALVAQLGGVAAYIPNLEQQSRKIAASLSDSETARKTLEQLSMLVLVRQGCFEISLSMAAFIEMAGGHAHNLASERFTLSVSASLKRRGHELKVVYTSADSKPMLQDTRLIRLLGSAYSAWDELSKRPANPNTTRRSHLVRLARLRFLAPDIITSILEGRHPVQLTTRSLLRIADLPVEWQSQRELLGF